MSNDSSMENRTDLRLYLSSVACNFLDFIHSMVFDLYFDGVAVKTGN